MIRNWKTVVDDLAPPTLGITLWIYLMIMIVGVWHYTVYIWDNWLGITVRSIWKVWSRAVNDVTKRIRLPHRPVGGNSHDIPNE